MPVQPVAIPEYLRADRHLVAVDCIIFGYQDDHLQVLLFPREIQPEAGKWSLVGGFVREDESLDLAARRVLDSITGLTSIRMYQVGAYSDPGRDSGARVISVAFAALVPVDRYDRELVREHGARWWPVSHLPSLIFDHRQMTEDALRFLQKLADSELAGRDLLPDRFTLVQIRKLHEAIFRRPLDPGNFRKKALGMKVLEKTQVKTAAGSKKGAFFYQFRKGK